jgi:hypothetical protein
MRDHRLLLLLLAAAFLSACSGGDGAGAQIEQDALSDSVSEDRLNAEDAPSLDFVLPELGPDSFADLVADDAFDPCLELPYGFGCECTTNSDCEGGYCVEAGAGAVCTSECFEDCPVGWDCRGVSGFGADLIFMCLPTISQVCEPCVVDDECVDGICHFTEDGGFCLPLCADGGVCPETTECDESLAHGDVTVAACVPSSGSCACNAANDGEIRPCSLVNEVGVCSGFETCVADQGWADCTALVPAAEICDGQDNNCDGVVDEGFLVDGVYALDGHCGSCNQDCNLLIANGSGVCDGASFELPKCVVDECEPGFYQSGQFQCLPPVSGSACQACQDDADCLGGQCVTVDGKLRCLEACGDAGGCAAGFECQSLTEDAPLCVPTTGSCECSAASLGIKKACVTEGEVGICEGTQTCQVEGWSDCSAPLATAEECDGKDNDCNGLIDDALGPQGSCTLENEFGVCQGVSVCAGALGFICQGAFPAAESCDGLDNNCDGAVDEVFKDAAGLLVGLNHCGECNASCVGLFPNAVAECVVQAGGEPGCAIAACAEGFFLVDGTQCAPESAGVCEACTTSDDCPGSSPVCATIGVDTFCSVGCQANEDCPSDYKCKDLGEGAICVPVTEACDCDEGNLGLLKGCLVTWPEVPDENQKVVKCFGQAACEQHGWGECALPAEVCDGVDNDCDGSTDETFKVDGIYATDAHCGKCGNDCSKLTPPGASASCVVSEGGAKCVLACDDGFADQDGNLNNGCECEFGGGGDVPDGEDQNCDGIDGEIDNAIFVAKWGNDDSPGTVLAPVQSIGVAMAKSLDLGKRDVYVAEGVYSGSIKLLPGIQMYGGFSSDFKKRDAANHATEIKGGVPTPDVPGALVATGINAVTTIVDGFVIRAKDGVSAGSSSYAIYIVDCDGALRIANNSVLAGNGAAGLPGAAGAPGSKGGDGGAGVGPTDLGGKACVPELQTAGGLPGESVCGELVVSGGSGGAGLCPVFEGDPSAAELGMSGSGDGAGSGGSAGWDAKAHHASCKMCILPDAELPLEGTNGGSGTAGGSGPAGTGCVAGPGEIVDGEWSGGSGSSGQSGMPGSGGGGGGAGAGVDSDKAKCNDFSGGTGGGGGGGGCGGAGGLGGGAGGGAFGFFIHFTTEPATLPVIVDNSIEGGSGGAGGAGGNGGSGGSGGAAGLGGPAGGGDVWCVFGGGDGGQGGSGGSGGGGGGGCGGPSYCFYVGGAVPAGFGGYKAPDNNCVPGVGGAGGSGGLSSGAQGQAGMAGMSAAANY